MGLVNALNAISSQVWAFLILVIGGVMVLAFHKSGIAIDIAAGVIGAAVNMFNSLIKPQQPGSQHVEVDSHTNPPSNSPTITVTAPAPTEPPKETP
jgi:hypothetical protein